MFTNLLTLTLYFFLSLFILNLGRMKHYADGVKQTHNDANDDTAAGVTPLTVDTFVIGRGLYPEDSIGHFASVEVYDRELIQAEIVQAMQDSLTKRVFPP